MDVGKKKSLAGSGFEPYRGTDKSLARPGRKKNAPVKSVMGREMD